MKKSIVAAVGITLALTACGSGSTEEASTPVPAPTLEERATPSQFASIIAEHQGVWREYEANIADCALARIVGESALDHMKVMTCGLTVSTVTLKADTALKNIAALPTPDPEVAALLERTVRVLTPLSQIDATDACTEMTSEACGEMETLVNGAIRGVIPVLDAWSPYVK